MQQTTLCFLVKVNEVCLAMKKRGFGAGKWNGIGGKVGENESIEGAIVREVKEEVATEVNPQHLDKVGEIKFYFNENPKWNQQMHIFLARKWRGEPVESEKMRPQWFPHENLPFGNMWVDDPHWLPVVLAGKKIEGEFYFKGNGSKIDKFEIKEL